MTEQPHPDGIFISLASTGLGLRAEQAVWILSLIVLLGGCGKSGESDQFTRLTNLGKSRLEGGDAAKAIDLFRQALALNPTLGEAQLNLANAYLLGNQPDKVIEQAQRTLQGDRSSAAA